MAEVRELNGKFREVAGMGGPGMCGYLSYRSDTVFIFTVFPY